MKVYYIPLFVHSTHFLYPLNVRKRLALRGYKRWNLGLKWVQFSTALRTNALHNKYFGFSIESLNWLYLFRHNLVECRENFQKYSHKTIPNWAIDVLFRVRKDLWQTTEDNTDPRPKFASKKNYKNKHLLALSKITMLICTGIQFYFWLKL